MGTQNRKLSEVKFTEIDVHRAPFVKHLRRKRHSGNEKTIPKFFLKKPLNPT